MNTIPEKAPGNYRWYLLGLSAATSTFVSAIPFSCMPVLFPQIANDLGLSLVQIGAVWGMASLAGVFVSLASGVISDRFGLRWVLGISCLLVGITGALRGVSTSFVMLTAFVFANGVVRAVIPVTITKAITAPFRGRNLGMAQGVGAMGMGLGLMLGPLVSATVLSPMLGGWRNVMFLYGAISAAFAVPWFLGTRSRTHDSAAFQGRPVALRTALPGLIRNRGIWLIALTLLFRMAGITGMTGYLPIYLVEHQGWSEASADSTLAVFYAVSTISVIPLATLSDRIGIRKAILVTGLVVMTASLTLISFTEGPIMWVYMVASGLFMDSFMAIVVTMLMETEGVGIDHAGTALGLVFTISPIGATVAAPLGNSLARISPGLPFLFWAGLSVIALGTIAFTKETGWRKKKSPAQKPGGQTAQ